MHTSESRLEILPGIVNSTLINDAYSNDYASLEIALDYLNSLTEKDKLIILSDLQQSSLNKELLYKEINTLFKNKNIQNAILIGDDFCKYKNNITINNCKFSVNTKDLI